MARAAVPLCASKGIHVACDFRDEDKGWYLDKGVTKAVEIVSMVLNPSIKDMDVCVSRLPWMRVVSAARSDRGRAESAPGRQRMQPRTQVMADEREYGGKVKEGVACEMQEEVKIL